MKSLLMSCCVALVYGPALLDLGPHSRGSALADAGAVQSNPNFGRRSGRFGEERCLTLDVVFTEAFGSGPAFSK
jgi:hypothetical protein